MSDQIAQCAVAASNHGMFVHCVSALTNGWDREGLISKDDKGRIQSCAARFGTPRDDRLR